MLSPFALHCVVHLIQNVQDRPGLNPGCMSIILIPDPFPLVHPKVRRLSLHSRYDAANPVGARRRPVLRRCYHRRPRACSPIYCTHNPHLDPSCRYASLGHLCASKRAAPETATGLRSHYKMHLVRFALLQPPTRAADELKIPM